MIVEVTMYRVVCDVEGCDRSPHDGTEYHAWADAETAVQVLEDDWGACGGWYVGEFGHLCDDHVPFCICGVPIWVDDEVLDGLCEDCSDGVTAA